jgi:hypothetical protein
MIERVREYPAQVLESLVKRIDRHRPSLHEVERAEVVETRDVIEVVMGKDHPIETSHTVRKTLLAEIRRCIDDHAGFRRPYPD